MIDFHTHLLFMREIKKSSKEWESISKSFLKDSGEFWGTRSLEEVNNRFDLAKLDYAVILPIDCERERGTQILTNKEVNKICSLSPRFIGFASVDPLDDKAIEKLKEAKDLDLHGLKLNPGLQGFKMIDVINHDMWGFVEKWNWSVVIHVGFTFEPHVSMYDSTVKDVEMLAEKYPNINFVIAHWGFPWTLEASLLAIKYPNVYLDTSDIYFDNPRKFIKFVVENQISVSILEKSIRNKVLFGSNYPRVRIAKMRRAIEELPLTDKCKEAILHGNAERLLSSALGG